MALSQASALAKEKAATAAAERREADMEAQVAINRVQYVLNDALVPEGWDGVWNIEGAKHAVFLNVHLAIKTWTRPVAWNTRCVLQ